MSAVRQILRLLARKKSMQAIIEMTEVSRNTLRKYQTRFQESGLSIEELLNLSDKELHDRIQCAPEPAPNARIQDLYSLMPHYEKELKRRGVTRELLWHEYRKKQPDCFGMSSTIITSQIPVGGLHDVIGENTVADAILDRIVYGAHRLELRGESLRKRANINRESLNS